MADRERDRDRRQLQGIQPQHRYEGGGIKGGMSQDKGPSVSKIIAMLAMLPAGGILLALAGITFVGTLIGLAVATPLFVIFSPVLVPAAITIGLAVMGFLTSGAFGLTALSSLSRVLNYARHAVGMGMGIAEEAKRRTQDTAGYLGQKTKEAGQEIQTRAHEGGGRSS